MNVCKTNTLRTHRKHLFRALPGILRAVYINQD